MCESLHYLAIRSQWEGIMGGNVIIIMDNSLNNSDRSSLQLFLKLLVIWTVWFRTSHSISPGVLLALANLQNQRARSIANALNWRAKAQYNVALARSKASLAKLGDRRVIRNSREFYPDDIVTSTQDNINSQDDDNWGDNTNIQPYNNQKKDFGLNQMVGSPQDQSEIEMSTIPTKNDYSRSTTDPVRGDYPTSVTQAPTLNIPNEDAYYAGGNKFDTDIYPDTMSPLSNILEEDLIAPEFCEYTSTEEKSAEADPHKHSHGHFHKHIVHHHNTFLEPPTRGEHLHSHQFTRPEAFEHQYSPQFARPEVNVHVFQNQHIGEVSSGRPFGHHVPSPSPHFFGQSPFLRSDAGPQYSPTEKVTFDEEQLYSPNRDVIGSTWNDEGEDQTLGTFRLPIFDTNTPEYPNLRDPYQFNTREPQNFQAIVRFIEDEQRSIDKMIHNLDTNRLHYKGPTSLHEIDYLDHSGEHQRIDGANDNYEVSDSAKERHAKGQKPTASRVRAENVGARSSLTMGDPNFNPMNMENGFPIPASSVPFEFNHVDVKTQQEMFSKYLETEQINLQRAIQELQEDHQRNLDNLLHYFNRNPNTKDSPDRNDMNIKTDSDDVDELEINTKHIEHVPEATQSSFDENTWLGNKQEIFSEADFKRREAEENENTEILTDFLQNSPGIGDRIGYSSVENPMLGHIIQVPERRYSNDEYRQRRTRSPNKYDVNDLDQLLNKENDTIYYLKKCAEHDGDLMMIGYIIESFINDLQNRLNKTRTKRQLDEGITNLPLARLLNDPKSQFNMPKTLENLGAIARNAFEHDQHPMYHVRNMVGSAKDAVVAAMKIPNQNFVFPSQYDIVDHQPTGLVGDINPSIFSNNWDSGGTSGVGESEVDPVMGTFQQVGSVIRESVLSGQQALDHVGDFANHAKSAIYGTRHTLPKIIQRQVPDFNGEPRKQTVIITPRIFDTADDNKVGQSVGETKYIKLGNILDALGVSNPNPSLNYEKITVEPRNVFYNQEHPMQNPTPNYFGNVKVEDINNVEEDKDFVGNALNNLEVAKTSVGAKNMKEFIVKMKNRLQTLMDDTMMQRKLGVIRSIKKPIVKKEYRKKPPRNPSKSIFRKPSTTKSKANDAETVGASFIPMELTHPFLNQPPTNQLEHFMRVNTESDKRNRHYEEDLGPVLGAINPMMFERIFNERLQKSNKTGTPHEVFSDYHQQGKQSEDLSANDKEVSTSMIVKGEILKPFMGQATIKNKKAFFKKYQPVKDDLNSANSKFQENYHEYESMEYPAWE